MLSLSAEEDMGRFLFAHLLLQDEEHDREGEREKDDEEREKERELGPGYVLLIETLKQREKENKRERESVQQESMKRRVGVIRIGSHSHYPMYVCK
jgi:hypothetical protein